LFLEKKEKFLGQKRTVLEQKRAGFRAEKNGAV
jgi:hypothetical protein